MVPKPVWERPEVRTYDPNAKTDAPLPTDLPESAKTSSTVSGRWWKTEHAATTRAQSGKKDAQQQDKAWKAREERRKREEAVKKLEREIKEEKIADIERKKQINKERKEKEAEKLRLQQMAARASGSDWASTRWWLPLTRFLSILVSQMSAKKLQRMKKRLGRTKKVAG